MAIFKSKKELVYDQLRAEILNGTYPPGKRLIIDGLASELGVSQIPIREALQQLQAEGFVIIEPHVGPRVAPIEIDVIWEIFQLLEALEIISCRAACQHMSAADLLGMEQMLHTMDALLDDPEQWSQENQHFHYALCEWGHTRLVKNLMTNVLDQWNRLRHYYLKDVLEKRLDLSQRDHWDLLSALRDRDSKRTEQIVQRHNQRALADYLAYLESAGHMKNGETTMKINDLTEKP
jgi:DNA-binding GntR family transcriptional regulator